MEEPSTILCVRASDRDALLISGSKRFICSFCSEPVLLAPSSQQMLRGRDGVRLICVDCAEAVEEIEIAPLNESQIGEVVEALWMRRNVKEV